ncbi:MAG: S-layer homology domain-containing protein [Oscillospiraceae bacterium]|jgi:hypothetical protein|nr:S-layer homology domain-containing protein [Oscillospiraceae bacterium]
MKLKKTLALVLALVLAFGTLSVASAATDFTDDADIRYTEAVDVMVGIGAIEGLGDGTFNPKGTITRAQAAKMIAYAVYGEEYAKTLPLVTSSFSDVKSPDYDWAIPSIEYLVDRGIINGIGDGKFAPNSPVTGYAFIKMLLVALGYGRANEFTGIGWELQVHNFAITLWVNNTDKAPIWDGLGKAFEGLASATREEAALYCFNALNFRSVSFRAMINEYLPSTTTLGWDVYRLWGERRINTDDPEVMGLFGRQWFADFVSDDAISDFYVLDEFVATIPYGTKYSDIPKLLGTTVQANERGALSWDNGELDWEWTKSAGDLNELVREHPNDTTPAYVDVYITTDYLFNSDANTITFGLDDGDDSNNFFKFMACYEYYAQVTKATGSDGYAQFTVYHPDGNFKTSVEGTYKLDDMYAVRPLGNELEPNIELISVEPVTVLKGKATSVATNYSYVVIDGKKIIQNDTAFVDDDQLGSDFYDYVAAGKDQVEASYILDSHGLILTALGTTPAAPTYYGLAIAYGREDGTALKAPYERVRFYDSTGKLQTLDASPEVGTNGKVASTDWDFYGVDGSLFPGTGTTGIANDDMVLFRYSLKDDGKTIDSVYDIGVAGAVGPPAVASVAPVLGDKTAHAGALPEVNTNNKLTFKGADYYLTDTTVVFYYDNDDTAGDESNDNLSDKGDVAAIVGYANFAKVAAEAGTKLDVLDTVVTVSTGAGDGYADAVVIGVKNLPADLKATKSAGFVYFDTDVKQLNADGSYTFTDVYVDGVKGTITLDKPYDGTTGNGDDVNAGDVWTYKTVADKTYFALDKEGTVVGTDANRAVVNLPTGLIQTFDGTSYIIDSSTLYFEWQADGSIEAARKPIKGNIILGVVPGDDASIAVIYAPTPDPD